ncbi:hypothetical protein E1N52_26460 [Paraburkholderia guartelaensis]|uniref:Uncharacterized protein n=1 Tax=Paraburkholderia guartelaensis TaxID=2546446 RepID=A0A4R5L8I3_9BURK|nr:hypothetical protein [Paraburkholderia guartelaensis]TDG05270.1 hypothetical protein E1N52_26460 [Paraburkholderia guartelaensis]
MSQIHHRPRDMRSIRQFVPRRWRPKALTLFSTLFYLLEVLTILETLTHPRSTAFRKRLGLHLLFF